MLAIEYDYDVILGMDWLVRYDAHIICKERRIYFEFADGTRINVKGRSLGQDVKVISACEALRAIEGGCCGVQATVSNEDETIRWKDIPIVHEFPEYFPDNLSMPPEGEVDFAIDIVPGTGPISKAPYRMTPAELKESEKKGFIRRRVSLGIASVNCEKVR